MGREARRNKAVKDAELKVRAEDVAQAIIKYSTGKDNWYKICTELAGRYPHDSLEYIFWWSLRTQFRHSDVELRSIEEWRDYVEYKKGQLIESNTKEAGE